jgi:hypothetical protein
MKEDFTEDLQIIHQVLLLDKNNLLPLNPIRIVG